MRVLRLLQASLLGAALLALPLLQGCDVDRLISPTAGPELAPAAALGEGEPIPYLEIDSPLEEEDAPIRIGQTLQLSAVAHGADGTVIDLPGALVWASSNPAVATVSQAGLVKGLSRGTTMITARAGELSGMRNLRVVGTDKAEGGGEDEGLGNNLSTPVIFAEGIGITALPVEEDPGLRPTALEGIIASANPFWHAGNTPNCGPANSLYCQKTSATWRAEWQRGHRGHNINAAVDWGDNLTHHTWSINSPIRVEVTLYDRGRQLTGYNMQLVSGQRTTEVQATDGTTALMHPTVYAIVPRLKIEKLSGEGGSVVATMVNSAVSEGLVSDGPGHFGAEINVAGKLVYGYNFFIQNLVMPAGVEKTGWWRITFLMEPTADLRNNRFYRNVTLTSLDDVPAAAALFAKSGGGEEEDGEEEEEELKYTPKLGPAGDYSSLDVYIGATAGGDTPGQKPGGDKPGSGKGSGKAGGGKPTGTGGKPATTGQGGTKGGAKGGAKGGGSKGH